MNKSSKKRKCHYSGESFKWGAESGKGGLWVKMKSPIHAGQIVPCPGCGKNVKVRGHLMSPAQFGMLPHHNKG